ncbi:serine hydrolase domain-containing protein [Aquiflexum sp.]|uniref:serine hydrolase domain-containing protein n=1 Tax=Aquiflexum sp. TaxID=1872584 RepID=UPI003593F39D
MTLSLSIWKIKSVPASEITIHHLLTHQSGLPNNYAADGIESIEAAISKIFSSPLKSRPGEGFIYSGNNYSLLAMIIEKVGQKSWEDFIQENILNPLDMGSTIFWYQYHDSEQSKVIPNFKPKNKIKNRNYGYVGPTGIFSTAHDLVKLNRLFTMNTLLTIESMETLNRGIIKLQSEEPFDKNEYGYGLFVKAIGDKNIVSLRGNEEGWGNAISYFIKENDVSIVVLSNVDELKDGKRPHIALSQEIIKILEF